MSLPGTYSKKTLNGNWYCRLGLRTPVWTPKNMNLVLPDFPITQQNTPHGQKHIEHHQSAPHGFGLFAPKEVLRLKGQAHISDKRKHYQKAPKDLTS